MASQFPTKSSSRLYVRFTYLPSQHGKIKLVTLESPWHTYILCCADDTLYTGITTDLERRLHEHNNTRLGAKYTRARRPVRLIYSEKSSSRSLACQREWQIKQLSAKQKRALITD